MGQATTQPAAASGAWTAPDTFTAKVCLYETPSVRISRLTFTGDERRCISEVNVAFGPTKEPELIGKAE